MTVPLPPAPPMFQLSEPAAAKSALERAGFRDAAAEEVPIDFHGRSPEDVFAWFDKSTVRTMALFRLQAPEVQRCIRTDILRSAEEFMSDGEVTIPCPALLYRSRKF